MIDILKSELSTAIANNTGISQEQVYQLLENPKSIEHGHLAFPVFILAKELKKAPPVIAQELKTKLEGKIPHVDNITAVGGYLNFGFDLIYLQNLLSKAVLENPTRRLGYQKPKTEKVVIDYSSPNVAKPMSIGHLRATMIGQAIRNLAQSQGYQVTGLNYLGDWGVQFGKLAYAYTEWEGRKLKNYDFSDKPFEALFQLYVDFHKAEEEDKDLALKGSLTFKRLEEGDKEIEKIWKMFLDISLNEYKRIYGMLNVNFDLIQGESFYNDKLDSTVDLIKKKGLLAESEGAQVVFLDEEMPPCILKKSDGASLYATRDIASALHRHDVMKGDHLLYVVGVDQNLHFKQVFKVLEKMGYDWAKNCHHIAFGMYRFKDIGKMSTRKGNVIFMDDVLNKAIELAEKIIEEKNPDLPNKKVIAQQVGLGAIIFNDLSTDRIKNVDFDWDRALDFEGDSGPYVQYCNVRCKSILKKFEGKIPTEISTGLNSPEEKNLVKQLLLYPEILTISYRNFKPSFLAQYLLEVCRAFGAFYTHHKILDDKLDEPTKLARLRLVQCTEILLTEGLATLGIQSPDKM